MRRRLLLNCSDSIREKLLKQDKANPSGKNQDDSYLAENK